MSSVVYSALFLMCQLHRKTTHLDIKTKILNDFYEDGLFDIKWIPSEDNPADALTKMAKQSVIDDHLLVSKNILARCFSKTDCFAILVRASAGLSSLGIHLMSKSPSS